MVAADLGLVRFDAGQSEQIVMNLAVNARDAMPDGGKLTIETANVRLDDEYVKTHGGVQPGDYVMLAVSDTGTGMSEDVRAHAFEPFFTTKSGGRGTGLGLAMIYGAVSQNGGHIEVYSEVGHGSTFKIYLPLVRGQEAAPVRSAGALVHPKGTETILLVEDEEQVRALASRVLARLGYQVRECPDGASALRSILDGADVRLLVTDVVMPDMNGRVLADRIRALRPDIKVLFTSGYTANVIVHHGVLKEGVEFLQKPCSGGIAGAASGKCSTGLSSPPVASGVGCRARCQARVKGRARSRGAPRHDSGKFGARARRPGSAVLLCLRPRALPAPWISSRRSRPSLVSRWSGCVSIPRKSTRCCRLS